VQKGGVFCPPLTDRHLTQSKKKCTQQKYIWQQKKERDEEKENMGLQETHGIELHVTEKEEPQPDPWPALIWPASLAGRGFDFFFCSSERWVWSGFFFFFFFFF
jgi:hypothetical protein